jgi:hypothetical protein
LENENADPGALTETSSAANPLCYGEDGTLVFQSSCNLPGQTWNWYSKNISNPTWTSVSNSGSSNSTINTNPLFENTDYKVVKNNNVCPDDEVVYSFTVQPEFVIQTFTADPVNDCLDMGVFMFVNYTSPCNQNYQIDWYKDNILINTLTYPFNPSFFAYVDPALNGDYSGTYYAVLTDPCCNTVLTTSQIVVPKPPTVSIQGPCYFCDLLTPITLTGSILYGINNSPTYQWYEVINSVDQILAGETNLTLVTNTPGLYKLVVTWSSTCSKDATYLLENCATSSISQYNLGATQGYLSLLSPNNGVYLTSTTGAMYKLLATEDDTIVSQLVSSLPNDIDLEVIDSDLVIDNSDYGAYWKYEDADNVLKCYIQKVNDDGSFTYSDIALPESFDISLNDGSVLINNSAFGIVMKSPDGNYWRLRVDDSGQILTELILFD